MTESVLGHPSTYEMAPELIIVAKVTLTNVIKKTLIWLRLGEYESDQFERVLFC